MDWKKHGVRIVHAGPLLRADLIFGNDRGYFSSGKMSMLIRFDSALFDHPVSE
jgi:hypothetical protein